MKKAFINGNFYTMKSEGDHCEAVVVQDGYFVYCGTTEEALKQTNGSEAIDLGGKTVLPGFTDSHLHVQAYADTLQKANLRNTKTLGELQDVIREAAAKTPKGELIEGAGFDHEKFDVPVLPTKEDLDLAAPEHPVVISRYCLHMNVANSAALRAGGIQKGGISPKLQNQVEVDENGEPTGRLWDQVATDLIKTVRGAAEENHERTKESVAAALKEFSSYGLTGLTPIQGKQCELFEETRIYQELRDEGRLTSRVYLGFDEFPGCGIRTGLGDEMIKYGLYKIYTDGGIGARTAYLSEPYSDAPSQTGTLNMTQEELNDLIQAAYDKDIQIGIHVIGDRALDMSLTAFENCYFPNPKDNTRFRLIHVSLVRDDLIERMKKLPIVCDIQPAFGSTNIHWEEDRVGEKRASYLYAWKRLEDAGIFMAGGSDCPVESANPITGIYAAVTRAGFDGYMPTGWRPENRLGRYEAVSLYTKNAPYASYEETIKGTIEAGKLADFIVLDKDLFTVPESELLLVKVEKTFLGGKEVYSRA